MQINQLNGGRIGAGTIVERGVPSTFSRDGYIHLEFEQHGFRHGAERGGGLEPQVRPGTATAGWPRGVAGAHAHGAVAAGAAVAVEDLQVTRAPRCKVLNARTVRSS